MSIVITQNLCDRSEKYPPTVTKSRFINVWVLANMGTNAITRSFNVSSASDEVVGWMGINLTNSMTNGGYPTIAFGRRAVHYVHSGSQMSDRSAFKCYAVHVENNAGYDTFEFHGMASGQLA